MTSSAQTLSVTERATPRRSARRGVRLVLAALAAAAVGLVQACSQQTVPPAPPMGPSFPTPDAAVEALVAALQPYDAAKVTAVLGAGGPDVLSSGDEVQDRQHTEKFLSAYRTSHEVVDAGENTKVLLVGSDSWDMPIPLVKTSTGWAFDTADGATEIRARRVGRNELDTIQTCLALVDAQHEYAAGGFGGAPGVYAMKAISDPGTKDGLYWPAGPNEPASPLGELVAGALEAGYRRPAAGQPPMAYHGYRFRLLTQQGPYGPGGSRSYLVDGALRGGFAVVAWPAQYGESGIMTFIVGDQGVVFEHDFGPDTESAVARIQSFDPDPSWQLVP